MYRTASPSVSMTVSAGLASVLVVTSVLVATGHVPTLFSVTEAVALLLLSLASVRMVEPLLAFNESVARLRTVKPPHCGLVNTTFSSMTKVLPAGRDSLVWVKSWPPLMPGPLIAPTAGGEAAHPVAPPVVVQLAMVLL